MKILFIGDSLTTGEGVNPYQTWPVMLSKTLHEQYPDVLCQILAWPGDTTRICLERMARQPKLYHGDIAVVQFGINDFNKWKSDEGESRVSDEAFDANLNEIIEKLKVFGMKQYIWIHNYLYLDPYGDFLLSDGIHLSQKGHRLWYENLLVKLKMKIKKIS